MAQNFIECDREQAFLMPPSLREWLPEDHLGWFVIEAVEDHCRARAAHARRRRASMQVVLADAGYWHQAQIEQPACRSDTVSSLQR